MLLSRIQLAGAHDDLTLPLEDAGGSPRRLVVLFGGEGTGKTTILSAVAMTRPGHTIAQGPPALRPEAPPGAEPLPPFAVADWFLGDDDPARPHLLRVMSPNGKLEGEREDLTLLRRREQALFDKRAAEGGFVLCAFSGARWFSRTPVLLTTPERTVLRYDVKTPASFDDPTRADLARETRQVLSFAGIAAALAPRGSDAERRFGALDAGLRAALAVVLEDTGVGYVGVDPARLEPVFSREGHEVGLDELPRSLRHRVAFVALTARALAAGYPGRDPRDAEGVVLLDDLEVEQDPRVLGALPAILRRALPRVQWIVTTASPYVAAGCDAGEVLALRRLPGSSRVELYQGMAALVH